MDPKDDPKNAAFAGPCHYCGGGVPTSDRPGLYPGALSRADNETYICSDCGIREALAGIIR